MSTEQLFTVTANDQIARGAYRLQLRGDTAGLENSGQFVNVMIPGFYLRRPLSVCEVQPGQLDLIYKVLGQGTDAMTEIAPGQELTVLSGLGNGFALTEHRNPLVVGGGVGVVPLRALVVELLKAGAQPTVVFGFNTVEEVFLHEETADLGVPVHITTVDGSLGTKGFVTDALPTTVDYVYACGPDLMLKALAAATDLPGQFSMEERMACGFGGCMGCVVPTATGLQRVCKEGPVFTREELGW